MATKRGRRRKDETRTPPILSRPDVDAMAKRRCLMLLAVLSGQQSVTQACADAQISAGTYYALETRALTAMLMALSPESSTEDGSSTTTWRTVSKLEERVKKLEQDKRRLERLLALTKKVVKPGPLKTPRGSRSMTTPSKRLDRPISRDQLSTPTPDSAGAPSDGTAS
jgi:hypothetical protein